MFKFAVILLALLLQSCSNYLSRHHTDETGFFADATSCFQSSVRKEYVKVPTAGTMTVIEVPLGNDANNFGLCMQQAGHPTTQADPKKYLDVSLVCLPQARNSSKPDATYAKCVGHSN